MSSPQAELDLALDWKQQLRQAFTRPSGLLEYLDISPEVRPNALSESHFQCLVTPSYANKMTKGDPNDPLLLQVLPLTDELKAVDGYVSDPVGDLSASPLPGVLHKYYGRALLIATGACAIHCRYCFRREFPYADHASKQDLAAAYAYLKQDPSISEVILSGGDPLLLSDRQLTEIICSLEAIPHIRRVRIHTRIPIVLPQRINQSLLRCLIDTRLQMVVVIHSNHAQEIQGDVTLALHRIKHADIPLLNQTVLLNGINDNVHDLAELSEILFEHTVTPYYLHLLDQVRGSAHYQVSRKQATLLYDQLRQQLPGYLVPRLVKEIAGKPYKTLLPGN